MRMISIELRDISVDIPIYNASTRSLKNSIFKRATGGEIGGGAHGPPVIHALRNVSLDMKPGDKLGLIGGNGSGKTTLLKVLGKILEPTSGAASIRGRVAPILDVSLGFDPEFTGIENIRFRGVLLGMSAREIDQNIDDIAHFTGLGEYLYAPVRTYSAGMIMRLAFAVNTSVRPDILLIDEWFGVGDARFAEAANTRISNLLDETGIVVMASHNTAILQENCDKGIWLESGKIQAAGRIEEVIKTYSDSIYQRTD